MLEEIVLFVMCFLFVLIIYEIFIVSRGKKSLKKDIKKYPIEVKYLIAKYKLDMEKVNYKQLLQIVAIVSSFDISIIVSLVMIFDSYLFQLLGALIIVVPVILISYHFVGLFYKKKGMIKDV